MNYSGADSRSWRVQSRFIPGALDTVQCTPDSPVNYSGAPLSFPEGEEFGLEFPGAPDIVRWHTGQSGAPDHSTLSFFAPFYLNTNFNLLLICVEPLCTCRTYKLEQTS